ncbi:MAG: dihydrodipicolinate synthase family protein [Marinifilaceae bacterium]
MKENQRLTGLIAAVFTPFTPEDSINFDMINTYADYIFSSGITGVFVCGTTGESHSLTIAERKAILEAWIKAAQGRFKVIAHVGHNAQKAAQELAEHAGEMGADAIAAIAPSFFKPSNVNELIRFFTPIAAAAPNLPFYYYNMPAMTGVDLSVADFLVKGKLLIPNLAGVKFTHNNLMEMRDCMTVDNGAFEILHGYDEILMAGLALGANAGVGSTYNYIPDVYNGIIEAMNEGNLDKARQLQSRSVDIVKILVKYGGGVRAGKAIMKLKGLSCGECRSPIAVFTDEEYAQLSADLQEYYA